ncbi:toprim domain-containing protein, partial [Candidatus Gracilibacteria bacterium]|nr:toprim domain-containing protein [Candidatus Gracilibacteria bacterium]
MLADTAGMVIPQSFGKEKDPTTDEKEDIFSLHELASEFFASQLQNTESAQSYLKKRGISEEVSTDWKLGYGGEREDGLTKFLLEKGFSEEEIARSGVAFEREFGAKKMRDRFLERLTIPIAEPRNGKIIAFTGRDLSGKEGRAKYLNSPENPVYHKSSTLFGLDRARKVIREKDFAILVEGNFDVITAHIHGFCNTVATCGTSLTEDHLRILKRLTKNIYLAFDTDIAGKKATLRAVEMILQMELNPFVIEIPEGKDIDELAQKNASMLQKVVEGAQNALLFLCEKFSDKYLTGSLEGEKKFLDALFYFLRFVHRPIERDELLTRMAKRLGRAKGIVEEEFQKFVRRNPRRQESPSEDSPGKKFTREECFVGFLSAHWKFFREKISEKMLDLLSGFPKELLEKKLIGSEMTDEEQKVLLSWELHEENLYGDHISEEVLERDAKVFVAQLQVVQEKKTRMEDAKKFGEGLKKNA